MPDLRTLARLYHRRLARRGVDQRPATSPDVSELQQLLETLATTAGDLRGKSPDEAPRKALSPIQRRMLRDALDTVTDLFALEDPALDDESSDDPPERSY